MNVLEEATTTLQPFLPVMTGAFNGKAPEKYAVITPMVDVFEGYADDRPHQETQEARISIYDKGNYIKLKNSIVSALMKADIRITGRRYIAREAETGYHHYGIDIAKTYNLKMEE